MNIMPQQYNPYQSYNQRLVAPTNGIIWVQGIEGAKAYQLMPNSNAILLDSDSDGIFYIKVSDNVGMCNLRIFKYEEITSVPKSNDSCDMSQYVTRDEFEKALEKLGGILNGKQVISTADEK